jgi:hypothetical protein
MELKRIMAWNSAHNSLANAYDTLDSNVLRALLKSMRLIEGGLPLALHGTCLNCPGACDAALIA